MLTLVVVLACAVVGVAAGVGWWLWWKPAPAGVVFEHHPFFLPDEAFAATGTYVAIAAPLGLVLGLLGVRWLRRDPLVAVVALLLGAVAGGAAMLLTGWLLGPESAVEIARHAKDGTPVRAALGVHPGVAWLAMPLATAFGCLGVLLLTDSRDEPRADA